MPQNVHIREATLTDIDLLHNIRMSVAENVLSNPLLATQSDYERFLTVDGKGWLATTDRSNESIKLGFTIVDTRKCSVWALFVRPEYEKRGVGRALQDTMLHWFFAQHHNASVLWLTTAPNTRAENFYRKSGWRSVGMTENDEIRFERSGP